ncbi:hypothetical protein C8Q77DRAFT_603858 [Trametes polyzona]|nr:hypothetical protein C8Q77DRAFT_603858 [Trametes polyzona]
MDHNDLNSLSEVESLSDSDWLDISSRASEENDSFADSDTSDREDIESDYRPPSRHSVVSASSSREGDVQGWEGIVEDSADEAPIPPPLAIPAGTLTDPRLAHLSLSFRAVALSESAIARHQALEDPEEEQRVKDALDQSMVSTLSGSRSNSLNGSVHTSVVHSRDMRLSFPDPLTSPRSESLSPSYEDISIPADTELSPSNANRDAQILTQAETLPAALAPTTPAADPSAITTLEVARSGGDDSSALTNVHSSRIVDFQIVLYGASSELKHRVVHTLLEKLMTATGCGFSALSLIDVPHNIRTLVNGGRTSHCIISVLDRTEAVLHGKEEQGSLGLADKPSLAVVFLPSTIRAVPEHTLYLPVLAPDALEDDDDVLDRSDRLLDAEQDWQLMCVPKERLVSAAFASGRSAVVEEDEIERASPTRVARALRPLLPWTEAWSVQYLTSRHAFTIFAILSIVLGYLINGSLPSSAGRRATPTLELSPHALPSTAIVNASASVPGPTSSSMALVSTSLKDLALAVLSPFPVASSSVATKAIPSPTASVVPDPAPEPGAPSECECGCGLITWPAKNKPTTDVVLRPTPPSPSLAGQAFSKSGFTFVTPGSTAKGKGKARATENDDSLYALSTRIAGALTEYIDTCVNFAATRGNDVQEILDALEDLGEAIGRQTEEALAHTHAVVEDVRKTIRARHERARSRAKEIRAAGERWISSMPLPDVRSLVRERVNLAKENARVIREAVVSKHIRREEARRVRRERREVRQERVRWVREDRRDARRERRADRRAHRVQPLGV